MKTFKHFPKESKCPICKTNEDKECILVPIIGTSDGSICEGETFHLLCLEPIYDKSLGIIYQVIDDKKRK